MRYAEIVRARFTELKEQKAAVDRGEDPRTIIPTGLKEYDKRAGIKRGQMTLIGAASGEGKDLWMHQLMSGAAKAGHTVEVWAPEDPVARTADRSFSSETGINNAKMLTVDIDDRDLAKIALATAEVEEWGDLIEYHDKAATAESVLKLMRESTADLRIVNYVQALVAKRGDSMEETIRRFCWELNELAKETGCATVAFAQMNLTKLEERGQERMSRSQWKDANAPPDIEGFRPYGISDLAWCQAAGIEAKDFQALFRPGKYLKRAGRNVNDDRMEITRPKNNFGAEGKVVVGLDIKTARFYDLPEKKNG